MRSPIGNIRRYTSRKSVGHARRASAFGLGGSGCHQLSDDEALTSGTNRSGLFAGAPMIEIEPDGDAGDEVHSADQADAIRRAPSKQCQKVDHRRPQRN